MMAQAEIARGSTAAYPRIFYGPEPESLTAIYDEGINASVWLRDPPALGDPRAWDAALRRIDLEASVPVLRVSHWLEQNLAQAPAVLRDDIAELVDMYACLFEVEHVGLRLKSLERAMCPRFHVDRVVCRLLTTYAGVGTEYLANEDVDRSRVGRPVEDPLQPPVWHKSAKIHRLPPGAVALCKGEAWPGNEGRGFVHRSPDPGDGARLLLSIDGLSSGY